MKINLKTLTKAGIIAALYAALTLMVYPIAFGSLQFRISEALTILPFFMPEAILGLFVGCIISNLLSPNIVVLDVVFGSLASLLAAYLTYRMPNKWLAPLPPVIVNAFVVGAIITFSMSAGESFAAVFAMNSLSVGAGQLIVCYGLGLPLMFIMTKLNIGKNMGNI